MAISEGVQGRVSYKAYATGVITENTESVSASDPIGSSGGQILRRVGSNIVLSKDTYQSAEISETRQIIDYRHGTRHVSGSLSGELSCLTYKDFFEAACRGTWAAAVTGAPSDFTSVAFDATAKTATFASGDATAKGFRVGMVIQFTGDSATANNSTNFLITSITGSGRVLGILPAPTTAGADTTFTVAQIGKSLIVPSSSHVQRKFAIEHYREELDIAELYTECRIGGFNLGLPASGMSTIEFPVAGRDKETYSATNAPFFVSPTAATTTGILQAVNGQLLVGGISVGVVTGLTIAMNLSPSTEAVVGQNFVPAITLGRANVTGQVSALFSSVTLANNFLNEDEVSVVAELSSSSAASADAFTITLPRVKFSGANNPLQGEGSQKIDLPFQALLYNGVAATAGLPVTTIQICDTRA